MATGISGLQVKLNKGKKFTKYGSGKKKIIFVHLFGFVRDPFSAC
jgi:hypothetical protein